MTIICVRDGVMAADGLATDNYGVMATRSMRKICHMREGWMFGAAGNVTDIHAFHQWCMSQRWDQPGYRVYSPVEPDQFRGVVYISGSSESGIWLFNGKGDKFVARLVNEPFVAIGCAHEIALGAMAMGASAERAVHVACEFNVWCGGEVQVERADDVLTPVKPIAGTRFAAV